MLLNFVCNLAMNRIKDVVERLFEANLAQHDVFVTRIVATRARFWLPWDVVAAVAQVSTNGWRVAIQLIQQAR